MGLLLHLLLAILALPVLPAALYLAVLTLLSARLPQPALPQGKLRFDILVPAHNESLVIERTIRSLQRLDWPADRFRIVVIADNCDDDTAQLARASGVHVLERHDPTRMGKNHALRYGGAFSAADEGVDAIVVIDADTVVSPNLLHACASRIEQGAQAVQVRYGVLNPDESWRTRLLTIAYAAFHDVRSRARERLGVSAGLRGNGMCLTLELLRAQAFRTHTITEDLEYGIMLGLAGIRVHYVDEAYVKAEQTPSARGAHSQRQRWERGRLHVIRDYTGPLLANCWRQRSKLGLDLALDLLTLPLGYIGLLALVLLLASLGAHALLPSASLVVWAWAAVGAIAVLVLHTLRGWQLSPLGVVALLDLLRVPYFIVWKLGLWLAASAKGRWVRTMRERK